MPEDIFDKKDYSLYKLHLHIDHLGFVWVNLDASPEPSVSWEEQFKEVDTQQRLQRDKMDTYVYDHTWSLDGRNFNWKTLIKNYNEVSDRMTLCLLTQLTYDIVLSLLDCPSRH